MAYNRWGRWKAVTWEKREARRGTVPVDRADAVLDYMFGDLDGSSGNKVDSIPAAKLVKLSQNSEKTDTAVRNRFGHFHQYFTANKLVDWESTPKGVIAMVVLLDHFPRKMYRGTRRQYSYDGEAQRIVLQALQNGIYDQIQSPVLRTILLAPLRNSESIVNQKGGKKLFAEILAEFPTHPNIGWVRSNEFLFERSYDAIERFGRFPDRNDLLGRPSKTEEVRALYDGTVMNSNGELKRSDRMKIENWTTVDRGDRVEAGQSNFGK